MTQEMSQITNGHVAANNINGTSGNGGGGDKCSFLGCQSAVVGAMERGFYRFGVWVAKCVRLIKIIKLFYPGLLGWGVSCQRIANSL